MRLVYVALDLKVYCVVILYDCCLVLPGLSCERDIDLSGTSWLNKGDMNKSEPFSNISGQHEQLLSLY